MGNGREHFSGPRPDSILTPNHVDLLLRLDRRGKQKPEVEEKPKVKVGSGREYKRIAEEADCLGVTVDRLREMMVEREDYYKLLTIPLGQRSLGDLEKLDRLEKNVLIPLSEL